MFFGKPLVAYQWECPSKNLPEMFCKASMKIWQIMGKKSLNYNDVDPKSIDNYYH